MICRAVLCLILLLSLRPLDAATLTLDTLSLAYTAGSGAVVVDGTATLAGANFSTGSSLGITMSITNGRINGEDLVQIQSSGPVTVSGANVLVNENVVGTYTPNNNEVAPLSISLVAGVEASSVEILIRHLAYNNLSGPTATAGTRKISIEVRDTNGTFSATRDVTLSLGNAVPVLTVGGALMVPRTARVPITNATLQANDTDHGPRQLTYELGLLPLSGNLLRLITNDTTGAVTGSEIMGGGTITFTQADVDGGRLRYDHFGGPETSDGFTVRVRDAAGATTPLTAVSITITGAPANAAITLPTGALTITEQGTAVAMDPPAPSPLSVSVVESDAQHYRRGELVVKLVNANGVDAGTSGDEIAVQSISGSPTVSDEVGSIYVSGSSIFIRHVVSGDDQPAPGTVEPYQLLGTIDTINNGTGGRPLRIVLASTVVQIFGSEALPNLPTGQVLAAESEVVTPAAVAQLIANVTLEHPGKNPPSSARSLQVTITEASPNTGSGSSARPVSLTRVNDKPSFSPTSIAFTAMVGHPLISRISASDPDLPAGAALSYRLATPVAGVVIDAASGAVTCLASNTTSMVADIIAQDDQGEDSTIPLQVTITPLEGVTAVQPYIITDPLVEIDAGRLIFHPFTVVRAAGRNISTTPTVAVDVVGDAPAGTLATVASVDHLSWTLTAPGVSRPASGIYSFGLRIAVTSGGITDIGYQPITLVVLDLSGSN